MKRRRLLTGAVILLFAARLPAQRSPFRVGMVMSTRPDSPDARRFVEAFTAGMKEHGYAEGRDYTLAVRYAGSDRAKIGSLADELIAWPADVLVANISSTAVELKKRTNTMPIVMATAVDAVGEGLVASLGRPGGNVTGMTSFGPPMYGKLVELSRELVPRARRIAFMLNPGHSLAKSYEGVAAQSAKSLGLEMTRLAVGGAADITALPRLLPALRADALVIATDGVLFTLREPILQAAFDVRLPAVALLPELAEAGAIATYGFDLANNYRGVARYIDRIRKGAHPGDLPIEQPTQFELVVNRKAASALGIDIPPPLLVRANRVIQ